MADIGTGGLAQDDRNHIETTRAVLKVMAGQEVAGQTADEIVELRRVVISWLVHRFLEKGSVTISL